MPRPKQVSFAPKRKKRSFLKRSGKKLAILGLAGALAFAPHSYEWTPSRLLRLSPVQLMKFYEHRSKDARSAVPTVLLVTLAAGLHQIPARWVESTRQSIPSTTWHTTKGKIVGGECVLWQAYHEARNAKYEYWARNEYAGKGRAGFQKLTLIDQLAVLTYSAIHGQPRVNPQTGIVEVSRMRADPSVSQALHYFAVLEKKATPQELAGVLSGTLTLEQLAERIDKRG
ncbi:MAG: hypothetical protein HY393_03085 [Candidatus Diapherotrites archaeon]|nr:hypothetical protein [Candidatus Diapherotrites archaeon]